ncbi:tail fiber domain-containing protein [Halobacteriovorax sp. HLS]|uniref:tail fiber domain-containing protein n=1 Tax=Halobacteriovorax sp. HLS TaxID=2234000 RepID=UPI000FD77FD0|nr:tail fiber domain-containing protein [Halobacteriovorax sp. HLS]
MSENNQDTKKKDEYYFGGIKEFSLEEIESEVLNESVYLDVFAGSDPAFKENVTSFQGGLDTISKMNVYEYDYKTTEFPDYSFSNDHQVGLMADELESLVPGVVATDKNGYKVVNYAKLTPVLTKAIQELTETVKEQQKVIEELKLKLN